MAPAKNDFDLVNIPQIQFFIYLVMTMIKSHKASRDHVWTYEEYYQLDDGKRYEIIEGELIDVASGRPTIHQKVSGNLLMAIMEYLNKHNNGKLLPGPIDVKFDEINAYSRIYLLLPMKTKISSKKKSHRRSSRPDD